MSDTPAGPPIAMLADDRLDSWKEIAAYLNRDVTTVQRWEKREGMPVRRHVHGTLGSVYAFRTELDNWARGRNLRLGPDAGKAFQSEPIPTAAAPARRRVLLPLVAGTALLASIVLWRLTASDYFWQDPLAGARFEAVTDFDGTEQQAAISRDGRFVAFLSDRDGRMDVWVTQLGTGRFHNLTRGSHGGLVNPSIRGIDFSPDGSLVTFWARESEKPDAGGISIWAIPTMGGEARPYLEGAGELAWSTDGSRLVYHTTGPGDPMFVRDPATTSEARQIYSAPAGLHAHFPLWSSDDSVIYFARGDVAGAMDLWRIDSRTGADAERLTHHEARVSHPVLLTARTLLYLVGDPDSPGSWLSTVDVRRRTSHRVGTGIERYTSLSASAAGDRLVLSSTNPKVTLWRLPLGDRVVAAADAIRIQLTTGSGFSPRAGPGFLLYVSSKGNGDSIWKLRNGVSTELWSAPEARVVGGPAISRDGHRVAFSIRQGTQTLLYAMNVDGTGVRVMARALDLQGNPAWAPDGQSITTAAMTGDRPRLHKVPFDGGGPALLAGDIGVDPVWAPDGGFFVYSGDDVGTTFPVRAATSDGSRFALPDLTLTRGARHVCFLPGRRTLVVLRGEIRHKNLWLIDLETGAWRQLTDLPADFSLRDFDVSPDGNEIVVERVQENSDVVLVDLARR